MNYIIGVIMMKIVMQNIKIFIYYKINFINKNVSNIKYI